MSLSVKIEKIDVWRETEESPSPDISFIPPMARRRLTDLEKAALAVSHNTYPHGEDIPIVFASRWGEMGTTVKLIKQFHLEGEMSPASFSTSVHNAAPGILSLREGSHSSYTAIAAGEDTIKNGFIEALSMRTRLLFVYAEEHTNSLYAPAIDKEQEWCAFSILMDSSSLQDVTYDEIPEEFDDFIEWVKRGSEG
jgi:hypothetical protein